MSLAARNIQIGLALIGLSGLILIFVPFTSDYTPLTDGLLYWDISDNLWLLVAPCVILPLPISTGYILWIIKGRLPGWLANTNYAFAVLFSCITLAGINIGSPYEPELLAMMLMFIVALASVVSLVVRGIRPGASARSLVAMQGVYSIPMSFWVAFAQDEFQSGAWLGVITLLSYLGQIALVSLSHRWWLAMVVSLAGIVSLMTYTHQYW